MILDSGIRLQPLEDSATPEDKQIFKMLKLACLFLCIVVASLDVVSAVSDEEKAAIQQAMVPIIGECSSEHGVSEGEIKAAKETKNPDGVKACFVGCVMKKTGFLDSAGNFSPEKGLENLKKYLSSDADLSKYEEIANKCAKVNDEPVGDGDAGCERAKLALSCAIENKIEVPV